jgi:hypothetical protein
MIRGLQITLTSEELSRRIGERIRVHEVAISALDTRLAERRGDQPFDVRAEDGFKTVGELEKERQQYLDRVTPLTLIRSSLIEREVYSLNRADLQAAELIGSADPEGLRVAEPGPIDEAVDTAIDGLKLKVMGNELRELLERRMHYHERCAERWRHEQTRMPEEETEDAPLLPDHMCANEQERHEWRRDVLAFIRDHIDASKTYRLCDADLAFGELLPQRPGWMEQDEYEREISIGFNLERLTKEIGRVVPALIAAGNRPGRDE